MKRITDPTFKYVPAAQSTPERLRAKFRKLIAEQKVRESEVAQKVRRITERS